MIIAKQRFVFYLLIGTIVLSGCVIQLPAGSAQISLAPTATLAIQPEVVSTAIPTSTEVATAAVEPTAVQEFIIPEIVQGKFNVAFVYSSPIGDGGWTYAHNQGRLIIEKYRGDEIHTGYVENVPEGPASEVVIRQLAQKGFDAIFTCSFGYMDPTATVAEEFPNIFFVHVSGFKKNGKNFASMFGSMEDMKYLAGMIAGARAKEDGSKRVGYIAPFPIPEVTRYLNASTMGMRRTCPDCLMDVRWTFSWFAPELENQAAEEMLDAGASVIMTGADTTGPIAVAGERGMWGIGYDSSNACNIDIEHCLTTPYWDWGQAYIWLLTKMLNGKFKGEDYYFEATSNGVGLLGFMVGEVPAAGIPKAVLPEVRFVLDEMLQGRLDRFSLFTGPIRNNQGELVVAAGVSLTQSDLEGLRGVLGRPACTICMSWLVEGIDPTVKLPE